MSCVKFKLWDFGLAEHIVLYCVMNFFAQVKKNNNNNSKSLVKLP